MLLNNNIVAIFHADSFLCSIINVVCENNNYFCSFNNIMIVTVSCLHNIINTYPSL